MIDSLFTLLLAISVFSNRVAEAVKSTLQAKYPAMNPDTVSAIALFTSLVAGILGALALNVNLFLLFPDSPYTANLAPIVGVVLAGCAASFGSEGLHWLLDLLQAGRDRLEGTTTVTVDAIAAPPAEDDTQAFPPYTGNQLH